MNGRPLLRPTDVAKRLGVSVNTLRRWERQGKLEAVRTKGNQRRFPDTVLSSSSRAIPATTDHATTRRRYAYCRVSSSKQKDDLERQVQSFRETHPDHEIIADVGSGLNFRRKGLLRMVERVLRGDVEEIVVSHKDRLCRFAFELVEWLCRQHRTRLVVKDQDIRSAEQELSEDLMAIVHVFSCRHHGMRRYTAAARAGTKDSHPPDRRAGPDLAKLDEGGSRHVQQGPTTRQGRQGEAQSTSEEAHRHTPGRG